MVLSRGTVPSSCELSVADLASDRRRPPTDATGRSISMKIIALARRHPVAAYFAFAYALSAIALLAIAGPVLIAGGAAGPTSSLLAFPLMVVGLGLGAIALTGIVEGTRGLRDLFSRLRRWRAPARWYAAALLVPPILILAVLLSLSTLLAPTLAPKVFPLGILFGIPAGFFEEIGWTGYAFPKLSARGSALGASIVLGILWGLWHAPVVDYLGAASPHGAYWLPFFLAFIALVTALRVLLVWIYSSTGSIVLTQLLHASSTGFLVVLGPSNVSAAQETLWYALYALALWLVVAVVVATHGRRLVRQPATPPIERRQIERSTMLP